MAETTWEQRMAARHQKEWDDDTARRVERNAREWPRDKAEQESRDWCSLCSEARPDGDSGRWMAFVTCNMHPCEHGCAHHETDGPGMA